MLGLQGATSIPLLVSRALAVGLIKENLAVPCVAAPRQDHPSLAWGPELQTLGHRKWRRHVPLSQCCRFQGGGSAPAVPLPSACAPAKGARSGVTVFSALGYCASGPHTPPRGVTCLLYPNPPHGAGGIQPSCFHPGWALG